MDHINLSYRWHDFEEAVLFFRSVLGLGTDKGENVAGPEGWCAAK
ncbi:hypothetical protein [Nesterenkonia pannonica]|nr:hypothetical protein [Nesterenkonia pannonica]